MTQEEPKPEKTTSSIKLEPRHIEWLKKNNINISAVMRYMIDRQMAREHMPIPKELITWYCYLCNHEMCNYPDDATCPQCEIKGFIAPTFCYAKMKGKR